MNDEAHRRAYFASLATPDLIVYATVERDKQSPADLALINEELSRRGVDPERLAVPQASREPSLRITPAAYSGPLPGAGTWWRESWQLFGRHFRYLATIALALFIPGFLLRRSLGAMHDWGLSLGMIAEVLLIVALDALWAATVFCGLNRRMREGHCSAGRAVALGIERWGHVFRQTVKVAAIACGVPVLFLGLGVSNDEDGFIAWGIILAVYPGSHLLMRYFWVQALAICKPEEPEIFKLSVRYSKGRYGLLLGYLLLSALVVWIAVFAMWITRGILPGSLLEALGTEYVLALLIALLKTSLLIGYFHVQSHPDAKAKSDLAATLPPPPELPNAG